ncbi:glycosyltransferase family 10 domain-containing protein [Falsiruegeria mediterranea]|uniref:glycosyltransferase family 10 domain-containing protein n=1 Tax=Falsiruegeria mediterranea TaxID=1280832 RepID=UPI0015F269EB|nr:glycosyltransferase family 10 [Falsiruegeria mediterranea]
MSNAAIAILPYGMGLGPKLTSVSVTELLWPLGCPERLSGKTVGDLLPTDHLIVYPKTATHFRLRRGTRAQISLVMGEPSVIHAKHLKLLRFTWRRFFRVLTFHDSLLGHIPNAQFFAFGTTWVPKWKELPLNKTAMCSLIASAKRDSAGHQLRHAIVDWVRDTDQDVQIMGRGYTPFDEKSEGLAPYRYSVVIENVQEDNYFSEKLLDAVFCNTVPIYWGCPNIERFVDPTGIIRCNSEAEVRAAIAAMSVEDFESRLPDLKRLQGELEPYADLERRAAQAIQDALAT